MAYMNELAVSLLENATRKLDEGQAGAEEYSLAAIAAALIAIADKLGKKGD